jgi:2'-5' RNA ligase
MRLFVAIELPDEVKHQLAEALSNLERQAETGHFVPVENLHLTLAFIGETKRVDVAAEAMRTGVESWQRDVWAHGQAAGESTGIRLSGIGSFKSKGRGADRGAHTWWVGIEDNPALVALAGEITQALRDAGFSLEKRTFKPHITLARGVRTATLVSLSIPPIDVPALKVSLMKSDLSGDKPKYTAIASVLGTH